MKKSIIICCAFITLLLTGCDILCDKSVKTITEYIGDWTCVGRGIDKIEGYANCKRIDGSTYNGDVWGHALHGKGTKQISNGDIQEGYFYNGSLIAGKVTHSDGSAARGLRINEDDEHIMLELGKTFRKNGIQLGEFKSGKLSYGMFYSVYSGTMEVFFVGDFTNNNEYVVTPNQCFRRANGQLTEITRTITNTVYRNTGFKNPLSQQGTILNPYVVNLRIKDY